MTSFENSGTIPTICSTSESRTDFKADHVEKLTRRRAMLMVNMDNQPEQKLVYRLMISTPITVPDIDPQDELCSTENNPMDYFNPLEGPSESTIFKILSTQGAQKISNFYFFWRIF